MSSFISDEENLEIDTQPPSAPAVDYNALAAGHIPTKIPTHPADVSEIGMATILGACSGYATKKLAKTGGLIVGASFLALQGLAHANIIKINWPRVEELVVGKLDVDGDGKFTQQDLRVMTLRTLHNLTHDLPASGGFAAAFFLGFRYG